MKLVIADLALFAIVLGQPSNRIPKNAPSYVDQDPSVISYPVLLPPSFNNDPYGNVLPSPDHGALLDVFSGSQRNHLPLHQPYPLYGPPYDSPYGSPPPFSVLPNPFYYSLGRQNMKRCCDARTERRVKRKLP